MKFIALLGRSRVGKDTAATILSETLGFPIVRLSSPVKEACHILFHIPLMDFTSEKKELENPVYGKTPRDLLVWMTTAIQKDFPPDFFFKRMLSNCPTHCGGVIIPDLRYAHDLELLRHHKALVLKITRSSPPVVHSHEDHIDALDGDIVLKNDGDIDDFEKRVRCMAVYIKESLESVSL